MYCYWTQEKEHATLQGSPLAGSVPISHTELGLSQLSYQRKSVELSAFQLSVTGNAGQEKGLESDSIDCFIRGCDLVVNYPETDFQYFSAQVYWRAWQLSETVVGIDLQLSLQTTLLESFPSLKCQTVLPASETVLIIKNQQRETSLTLPHSHAASIDEGSPCGILVRPSGATWSYFECIQSADDRGWTLEPTEEGHLDLLRLIGGEFQEKGVIRRFRLRSAFMPRRSDREDANHVLEEFAEQPLPLTA